MAWPTDWAALFGVPKADPLIVEIGFGYGHYLLHLATQHPQACIVGIEVTNKCLTKVENTLTKRQIHNARVLFSTAETALYHLFETAAVREFHINFPDPWFKSRHEHRRLMKPETVDALVNRLAPDGMLYLATDISDYAEMTAELLEAAEGLENTLSGRWANSLPGRTVTKYEARAIREGRTCYYFAYRRNTLPPPAVPNAKELELDMPHMVFSSPLSIEDFRTRFTPSEHNIGDVHIRFLYVYQGDHALLFDTYIREPTIDQRLSLLLVERADGYTLKLGIIGHPRPTRGVHVAVKLLGDWLLGQHPTSTIAEHKLKEMD